MVDHVWKEASFRRSVTLEGTDSKVDVLSSTFMVSSVHYLKLRNSNWRPWHAGRGDTDAWKITIAQPNDPQGSK